MSMPGKMTRRGFMKRSGASLLATSAASFSVASRPRDYSDNRKRLAEWTARAFTGDPVNLVSNLPSGRIYGGREREDLRRLFWLQNCNLFAMYALRPYDPAVAKRIETSYGHWYETEFSHCEERTEHYLPLGRLPNAPAPEGKFHQTIIERKEFDGYTVGTESLEASLLRTIRDEDPRGLLKFGVLSAQLRGEKRMAEEYFRKALALWDGNGFLHTRMDRHGSYYTRYLAYALIADRALGGGLSSDLREMIEQRLWSLQDEDGGLWTNYNADGSIPDLAKKTTEIGPLALLAYDEEIWPCPV
jgi:hypothetical protein